MRNKFKKISLLIAPLICLAACTFDINFETSSEEPYHTSTSYDERSYEKDDEGFYILEDDYFHYEEDEGDTGDRNQVYIPPLVEGKSLYSQFRMFIGDRSVPIYNVKTNFSQTWTADAASRMNNAVATIGLKGKVEIKLQLSFNTAKSLTIRPLNKKVPFTYDPYARVISFLISDPGQYVVECTNDRTLHLFVNDIEDFTNPYSNAMVFEAGVHNKSNDSRINSSNEIVLSSNQKVFIAANAFIEAKFIANNASNIEICGPGYIDGSVFERNANNGTVLVPLEFNYCNNLTFKNFSVLDPAGWCYNLYFTNNINIENTNIISSRSNGDGISIQSCNHVDVKDCFVRTWDDSLVVKNYPKWYDRNQEGSTDDITFSNCILWTDLAQSMEVGYECVGETMKNITFQDITVLHNFHKAVLSIHNGNNANLQNVTFKNITVEDAAMGKGDGNKYLVDFSVAYSSTWSSQHKTTALGSVDGVEVSNVKVLSGINKPNIRVSGSVDPREGYSKDPHYISNVTFTDFELYGDILNQNYENYFYQYANNVSFASTGNTVTGHVFIMTDVSSYGHNIDFL